LRDTTHRREPAGRSTTTTMVVPMMEDDDMGEIPLVIATQLEMARQPPREDNQLTAVEAVDDDTAYDNQGEVEAEDAEELEPREVSVGDYPPDDEASASGTGGLINGFTILASARARLPEEVHIADLSGQGFSAFEEEDLEFFQNLRLLDVGDNQLSSIEELSRLGLAELRAPVNDLSQLNVSFAGAFGSLKVLDVSYNRLGPRSLNELATLASLQRCDVSGNEVGGARGLGGGFKKLHTLVAENCGLRSFDLVELAVLPALRDLKLSGNPIEGVPDGARGGYPSLETLDLSRCALASMDDVAAAEDFPKLRRLLMEGNEVKLQGRLSRHPLSGKVSLGGEPSMGDEGRGGKKRFTVSQMYSAAGGLKRADLEQPSSRMQAFASVSQEDIDEAFERLKDPMSIFASEDYEYEESGGGKGEEEGQREGGGAFLTSLAEGEENESESEGAAGWPEEELDPSSKLAVAFGLDPAKVFSADHLGSDAAAAINALKFALNHPLVDYNATGRIEHHMKLTESAQRRKLETRRVSQRGQSPKARPSKRKEAIQDMLERMKEKLATAKEKLAAVPAS